MEEIETPTEKIVDQINEEAQEAKERWISWVALSTALLAVFAAVTALLAGNHANEAMIEQIQASDQWNYYQAKGIKASVLATRVEIAQALGKEAAAADREKLKQYGRDQEKISEKANELQHSSASHLAQHEILARGVTMFQVAIAIAAIAVLTRRPPFWFVGLAFGALGLVFLVWGLLPRR
jgi:hypothetical protein